MAMENCPWSWVPDEVEALQNGPGFFWSMNANVRLDHFWMNISKSFLDTKVQDS